MSYRSPLPIVIGAASPPVSIQYGFNSPLPLLGIHADTGVTDLGYNAPLPHFGIYADVSAVNDHGFNSPLWLLGYNSPESVVVPTLVQPYIWMRRRRRA